MIPGSGTSSEPNTDHAVAGGISGFVTRFLCQPLDVLKIRFQLQVEPIKQQDLSKYRSILQGFILIVKEEGVPALWKGHVPAQVLSITYGMTQFYSYHIFAKYSNEVELLEKWKISASFINGALAGVAATVVSYPFDTIRTRLIAQSEVDKVYVGTLHSCRHILENESPRTFFRGLLPTLLQIAPHTGLQFAFYGFFTDLYKRYSLDSYTSVTNSAIAGSAAGLLAKTIVYPFDLARKRLQIQGFEHGRRGFGQFFHCDGLIHCIRMIIHNEGIHGLFKGLAPSLLKATVTTALHFTVYEQSLLLLKFLRSV